MEFEKFNKVNKIIIKYILNYLMKCKNTSNTIIMK